MNLIVVIASVAVLVAFFYFTVWPIIKENFDGQVSCEKAVCQKLPDSDGMVSCQLGSSHFKCPFKG